MSKKQIIMEKALELFAKQGFESTSIQQITDYCGISKGAFYLSFKSKDQLIIALIDHFMEEFISDIDHLVKTSNDDALLYTFYHTILQSFRKHSDFGKLLIKEQTHTLNDELLEKLHYYNNEMDKIILYLIERQYGEEIKHTKYDLMYCIKSFTGMYSELFLFNSVPLDLDLNLLSQSLVEKTSILATHTTITFISEEIVQLSKLQTKKEIKKEEIIHLLEQKIEDIKDAITKESLILLKQHILERNLSPAIVTGLIKNLQNHPDCKWISYLLRGACHLS
ncbi:TetR/AcrR family transcriptional regulator [Oceanobacillus bengalensis]|uniref:TetR/AcrR family transcriptional regulator n=1 Tax=Oceanobacillus bengalensis TaxID=1435466 RepID=A0A494Z539_9BACI|nr:TetR/AcrR family transcriptional regulator [Oceanobacillus bengalensis]RKQ17621.1 TetR/AcrR family transcriptional regulator [Oceanobacillus bengalensis]